MNFIKQKFCDIMNSLYSLGKATASFICGLALIVWELICICGKLVASFGKLLGSAVKTKFVPFVIRKSKSVADFWHRKATRFFEYVEYLKQVYKRKGFIGAVSFIALGDGNTKRFRKSMISAVMNYVAPVMAIVLLFNVVAYATSAEYVIAVSFDGETIAYIENEKVYNDAEAILRSRIYYAGSTGEVVELEPDFNVVKSSKKLTNKSDLADILMTYTSEELSEAYGVYAGTEFIGAVSDKSMVEAYVNEFLETNRAENPGANITLSNDVYYIEGVYLNSSVKTVDKIKEELSATRTVAVKYTVSAGDNIETLAQKAWLSVEEFQAFNPDINDSVIVAGTELTIKINEPYLCVVTENTFTVAEPIAFEKVTKEDPTVSASRIPYVSTKGKKGSKDVTYTVTSRNGMEFSKVVTNEVVTLEPVHEVTTVGTLINVPQSNGANSNASATAGKYIWPVGGSGGYISCPFSGAYGHTGLDIAAPSGTPIYAAFGGTVIKAQTSYTGYGKLIVIQNDDGYVTYYAHCSYIGVTVGQQVKQGDFIGEVGTTGYSTGNHLHFEVRSGKTYLNPLNFVER